MRNLILAFGLILFPAVVMAAPSQHSCKIASKGSSITTTGCTATERKLVMAAQNKPTTKQVDAGLQKLAGKQYLVINTLCALKGGRRKAARRLVKRCYRSAGEGQRLILSNALNNLGDIKACMKVKGLAKQVNCMIDQNNRLLLPLIERTLDAHEAYMKGLKFMIDRGCTFKGSKLKCAGFNHTGGILLILLTLVWGRGLTGLVIANVENKGTNRPFDGMWVACRTMIIAVTGIVIVLAAGGAYGACTDAEVAGNEVAAQYGMVLYDCDEDEVNVAQKNKDAVFEVIWTAYKAKGGFLNKSYIKTRWERVEGSFWAVWKDSPLWQAKIAVAICAKETLCGVDIKFSNWESYRFESPVNNNGTKDCGITQINSNSTNYSCDELQNHETAFQEQKRIIQIKVGSQSRSKWKARISRYNGSGPKAKAYGKIIMTWAK
jgi:hypothetical protein